MKRILLVLITIMMVSSCSTMMSRKADYQKFPSVTSELAVQDWENDYFAVTDSTKIYSDIRSSEVEALIIEYFKTFDISLERTKIQPLYNYIKINITTLGMIGKTDNFMIQSERDRIVITAVSVEEAIKAVEVLKQMQKESVTGVVRIWAGKAGK